MLEGESAHHAADLRAQVLSHAPGVGPAVLVGAHPDDRVGQGLAAGLGGAANGLATGARTRCLAPPARPVQTPGPGP